jgi:PIN domain nuclease of toxin-antitoxin system
MKLLLDTHLLLGRQATLSTSACGTNRNRNPDNDLMFSAASLWEVAIKRRIGRRDFIVDPRLLRGSPLC